MGVAHCAVRLVHRAAVRALSRTRASHVKINLGMRVPLLHASHGRWTVNAALGVEVGGLELDGVVGFHSGFDFTEPPSPSDA